MQPLNDFQVLKGRCEKTMRPFGQAVSGAEEAALLIRDDRRTLRHGEPALYVVHQRSENRLVKVVDMRPKVKVNVLRAA